MEKEGDPHTLAQGPSVTGSKGLALGMCLASLHGLEGEGDRVAKKVPEAELEGNLPWHLPLLELSSSPTSGFF